SNGTSAQFGEMFLDGRLYGAFFGHEPFFTTYECPWELKLGLHDGFDKQLEALKKMCEAVIAGRCEHRVTRFTLVGTITAGDSGTFRVVNIPIFHPRRLRTRI